jgi:flagellar biogenesis protein FliO
MLAQDNPSPPPSPAAEGGPRNVLNEAYPGEGGTPAPPQTGPAAGQTDNQPVAVVNSWDFINMILGLLVVVAIIYLIFYFLKKGMGKRIVENELIKVLGSRVLSGSKSLHLVEVGGTIYLIGSANDSVTLISEISQKEARDAIMVAAAQTKDTRPPRFLDVITNIFKPGTKKQLEINESIEFMKKQRSRLNKFKQ